MAKANKLGKHNYKINRFLFEVAYAFFNNRIDIVIIFHTILRVWVYCFLISLK